MSVQYKNNFKKKLCKEVCIYKKSTSKTADTYGVPLKTLEKWITAFNKNPNCFDSDNPIDSFEMITPLGSEKDYNDMSYEELKKQLMKKDIEIARLKKGYLVKEGGMGEKVFTTFSKKNTK